MRLHSSLSSGAYVKRKGTPLGTLTSKKLIVLAGTVTTVF